MNEITLVPLTQDDRERFIRDNQEAFKYGALEEFGRRDDHFEEGDEIISRATIEASIDGGEAYRIMRDGQPVGGVVVKVAGQRGELELLFVPPPRSQPRHRPSRVARRGAIAPGSGRLGNRHPLLRETQHSLLRQSVRVSHRGVLQPPPSKPP